MKRLALAAASLGVVLAACGGGSGGSPVAATVNGTNVSVADVEGFVAATAPALEGEQFTQILDVIVQWTAIEQAAAAQFGLEPTEAEIDTEVAQLIATFGAGATLDQYLEAQGVSEGAYRRYAAQLLIGDGLVARFQGDVEEPTEAEAQEAYDAELYQLAEVCASHILVETSDEAAAVEQRLAAGEEFSLVAQEVSIDTGSGAAGGSLGCAAPAGYVTEFADATMTAEIGVVTAPVESQFGFHIIRVDSRTLPTLEEVRTQIWDARVVEVVDAWYLESLLAADVTVDPEFGTWSTDPIPEVVAPG